jgi:predicted RNase H-like HicB family nuclease
MDQPKYRIEIFWSDEDGGYIANVPDLRYCSAFGETYEEALREVLVAMELHLDTLRELGRPIPEPTLSAVSSASEPAEKFAEAIKESYQALADRSVSAQELNAQLTQDFFNGVINNLRIQAESNRERAEDPGQPGA